MGEIERILRGAGGSTPTSKGWIALADIFARINYRFMFIGEDDQRERLLEFGNGLEGAASLVWSLLRQTKRSAILQRDGQLFELRSFDQGPASILHPATIAGRDGVYSAKDLTSNALVSLSVGTIGSGYAIGDERIALEELWAGLWGRPVFIRETEFEVAFSKVLGNTRPRGRPSNRTEIASAYHEEYPDGHQAVRESWKTASNNLTNKLGFFVTVDTLKRALGLKK